MPFTYQIEDNGTIVHIVGVDRGDLPSARATLANFMADAQLSSTFGLLIDVRPLRNMPSMEEAESLSTLGRAARPKREHCAALVVKPGLQYGVARIIQALAELKGARISVFTDDAAALEWVRGQLPAVPSSGGVLPDM